MKQPRRHLPPIAVAVLAALGAVGCRRSEPSPAPPPKPPAVTAEEMQQNDIAVGLMGQYRYDEALAIFRELADAHPGHPELHVNLAIATLNRQEEQDEQAAIGILRRVLSGAPAHARARYVLALLLFRNGENEEAETLLRAVAAQDPTDGYVQYFLGQVIESRDPPAAEAAYREALRLEPYLRSAAFRLSSILRRAGDDREAEQFLDLFIRLESNPRARTARYVYSEMGTMADAMALGPSPAARRPRPAGGLFEPPVPIPVDADDVVWRPAADGAPPSISACDPTGDGRLLIFIADAVRDADDANAVLVAEAPDRFRLDRTSILSKVTQVRAALFGDYDNDGLIDVYLCRRGPNQLWRRDGDGDWWNGAWIDVTGTSMTDGGVFDTIDGVFADLDHDGDLDLLLANADGPTVLLSNNRDGTFRRLGAEHGLDFSAAGAHRVLAADLDGDRDLDFIVLRASGRHEVWRNDRLWTWSRDVAFAAFEASPARTVVAADPDATGRMELVAVEASGHAVRWSWDGTGLVRSPIGAVATTPVDFAVLDITGDGAPGVLVPDGEQWRVVDPSAGAGDGQVSVSARGVWAPVLLDPARGPAIVGMDPGGPPRLWRAGDGRHPFTAVRLLGRDDPGNSLRTNAAGIGAQAQARVGGRWVALPGISATSLPGQSYGPAAVGLAGFEALDIVRIDWPDGVFQTEVAGVAPGVSDPPRLFSAGRTTVIAETQRQVSSCPVLFAWDGSRFVFISDVLGVGGMGYLLEPGVYAEPRPWERFQFPPGLPVARDGRIAIKLAEPMEETLYLDALTMVAYDLPEGWSLVLDERMQTGLPTVTGETRFYREERRITRAVDADGRTVTTRLRESDGVAPGLPESDRRFIGLLSRPQVLTMEFDGPLDRWTDPSAESMLIIDGWVEYPYSQTMFAAWQAGAVYEAPTVEARRADGAWIPVLEKFGYPAGFPRRMSVALEGLPEGCTALRLTTTQEIYFDRVVVAGAETPPDDLVIHRLTAAEARVASIGFPHRSDGPQRRPQYDYERRAGAWDTRIQRGWYTEPGPALPLVVAVDGALAIIGPGDEVHVEFEAPASPTPGFERTFVLECHGWCKDMDLFTRHGETVEPLPVQTMPDPSRPVLPGGARSAAALHEQFNRRFQSGRAGR